VEQRLIPVNAVIALCTPGDLYPAPLAQAGYRLAGVEVPVLSGDGRVVIDCVAFRGDVNRALIVEAKSGANLDGTQATRYGLTQPDDVIRSASITVTTAGTRVIQSLYVCLAEHAARVLLGLGKAGVEFPVLTVDEDRIVHSGAPFTDPDLQAAFAELMPVPGPPPRFIPFDDLSPDKEVDRFVLPGLVSALSHQRPQISVPVLAEGVVRHLPLFGTAARQRIVRKVDDSARRLSGQDPSSFRYLPRTGTRHDAAVEFVRAPEGADRRGRTQSYQAIGRAATRHGRMPRVPMPGEVALFDDVIGEMRQGDQVAEDDDREQGDEGA